MNFKRSFVLFFSFVLVTSLFSRDRIALRLPDIGDYKIIKCDFHNHSVFSDGHVWLRPATSWRRDSTANSWVPPSPLSPS